MFLIHAFAVLLVISWILTLGLFKKPSVSPAHYLIFVIETLSIALYVLAVGVIFP